MPMHQALNVVETVKRTKGKEQKKQAKELINEWLELAKEVGDMNLNRMDYDETRYNKAIQRMEEIRVQVAEYNEHKHEN